jgi:hypothetical protein
MKTTVPAPAAVLVSDVQAGLFLTAPAPFDADGVLARINALIAKARAVGVPVSFIQPPPTGLAWRRRLFGNITIGFGPITWRRGASGCSRPTKSCFPECGGSGTPSGRGRPRAGRRRFGRLHALIAGSARGGWFP